MENCLKRRRKMFAGDQMVLLKVALRYGLAIQLQKSLKKPGKRVTSSLQGLKSVV